MQYNSRGNVTHWGYSNSHALVEGSIDGLHGVLRVPAWAILWVDVYIADIPNPRLRRSDRKWALYARYAVTRWEDVRPIFDCWFGTAGYHHRVSFSVAEWIWTWEAGWEWDDQL